MYPCAGWMWMLLNKQRIKAARRVVLKGERWANRTAIYSSGLASGAREGRGRRAAADRTRRRASSASRVASSARPRSRTRARSTWSPPKSREPEPRTWTSSSQPSKRENACGTRATEDIGTGSSWRGIGTRWRLKSGLRVSSDCVSLWRLTSERVCVAGYRSLHVAFVFVSRTNRRAAADRMPTGHELYEYDDYCELCINADCRRRSLIFRVIRSYGIAIICDWRI